MIKKYIDQESKDAFDEVKERVLQEHLETLRWEADDEWDLIEAEGG